MNILFLLVPVLGIASYYLALIGLIIRNKTYSKHVVVEHYILNPSLHDPRHLAWFSPFVLMNLVGLIIIGLLMSIMLPSDSLLSSYSLGFFFGTFGVDVGIQLFNVGTFYYSNQHPEYIKGTLHYSHEFMLFNTQCLVIIPLLFSLLCILVQPTSFLIGTITGMIMIIIRLEFWKRKYIKRNL